MRRILLTIALALGMLLAVLFVRTERFTSRQIHVEPAQEQEVVVNAQDAAQHLAATLRFRTVSFQEGTQLPREEFLGLHRYLEGTFPKLHAVLARETVADYSLLYAWKGSDAGLRPLVLMAHQDVVPVEPGTEKLWAYPPFDGRIAEGYIWGRGSMDDKACLAAILEAVEKLVGEGFRPRRTIYLAFGHDEEVGGQEGARAVAELLGSRGIRPEMVLDEGGVVIQSGALPIARPVALVGVAEKGYLSLELTVQTEGGHSSAPPAHTAVGILSAAITNLESHPFPGSLRGPAREMFEYLGPEMPFTRRLVFANLWLFGRLVERRLEASPASSALVRTTTAPTIIEGGVKDNVLPNKARAVVNFRILPGDSIASVLAYVRQVINDPRVQVQPLSGFRAEPSPVSSTDSPAFAMLMRTVRQVFPDAVVAPMLVIGGTDARYYAQLTESDYRFDPFRATDQDLTRVHGTNERIAVENYVSAVKFYIQLIRNSAQ
jgi:carboxypeptidase PM20D1